MYRGKNSSQQLFLFSSLNASPLYVHGNYYDIDTGDEIREDGGNLLLGRIAQEER